MLHGIDISNWQDGIDIYGVDADFVICKATEGVGFTDPTFAGFADAVLDSGKLLGAYHFARTNDAIAEADAFLDVVWPYLGKCLLALDFEADAIGNGVWWAKEWLDHVKERTGITPVIYMSKSVCRQYDWSAVASDYPLWGAQYANYDRMGYDNEPWTDDYGWGAWSWPDIYQYSSSGDISGYSGNLDINNFYGNKDEWIFLGGETDMQLNDMILDSSVKMPDGVSYYNVANCLYKSAGNSFAILDAVKAVDKKVGNIAAPKVEVNVDIDAIARKVADKVAPIILDKLAERLKE